MTYNLNKVFYNDNYKTLTEKSDTMFILLKVIHIQCNPHHNTIIIICGTKI